MINTEANDAVAEIDAMIESLLRKRSAWVREIGIDKSDMKQSDVAFIDRQIERLDSLKIRVNTTLESVRAAIEKHTEKW